MSAIDKKSHIILYISAHGADLPKEKLDRFKPFLHFSLANKGSVSVSDEEFTSKIENFLNEKFDKKPSIPVSDILDELTQKIYTDFDYIGFCKRNKDILEKGISSLDSSIGNFLNKFKISHEKFIQLVNDCECGYVAKPRVINVDRLYDFCDEKHSHIQVFDIRNPKNENQTEANIYDSIQKKIPELLEGKTCRIKLSEFLSILYDEYEFDYVTIIDFACRVCHVNVCDVEMIQEIEKGKKLSDIYRELKLGGRTHKKPKSRMKKKRKSTKRRKTIKK